MGIVGELPKWLDVDFVRQVSGGLVIVALLLLVVVMFTVRSVITRVLVVAMLGAAVFGLLHYRSVLGDCDTRGCPCEFFGEALKGGGCRPG